MFETDTITIVPIQELKDFLDEELDGDASEVVEQALVDSGISYGTNADILVSLDEMIDIIDDNLDDHYADHGVTYEDITRALKLVREKFPKNEAYWSLGC